jgi:hypothetical protein
MLPLTVLGGGSPAPCQLAAAAAHARGAQPSLILVLRWDLPGSSARQSSGGGDSTWGESGVARFAPICSANVNISLLLQERQPGCFQVTYVLTLKYPLFFNCPELVICVKQQVPIAFGNTEDILQVVKLIP